MKIILHFLILFIFLIACAVPKRVEREITAYRAEKIKELTTAARRPLQPGDEKNLDFYPIQKKYRPTARFTPATDTLPFDMPTYSGLTRKYQRYGRLHFTLEGRPCSLALYRNLTLAGQEKYRYYLFMPFKDVTNGETTYGGGRYLDLSMTDLRDGTYVLDFNKVYNPWCAYSDGFNCPIPPAENHLAVAVQAGERNYKGEKHH